MEYMISKGILDNGLHDADQKVVEKLGLKGEMDVANSFLIDQSTLDSKKKANKMLKDTFAKEAKLDVDVVVVTDMMKTFEELSVTDKQSFYEKLMNAYKPPQAVMQDTNVGAKKGKKFRAQAAKTEAQGEQTVGEMKEKICLTGYVWDDKLKKCVKPVVKEESVATEQKGKGKMNGKEDKVKICPTGYTFCEASGKCKPEVKK